MIIDWIDKDRVELHNTAIVKKMVTCLRQRLELKEAFAKSPTNEKFALEAARIMGQLELLNWIDGMSNLPVKGFEQMKHLDMSKD